ncbi:MAG TPA: hypothetical protein VF782_15450 [Allosphingosinicella sp.]|jgi:hypothetical protein
MKPFAIAAAALFALAQPALAQAPTAAPSEALVERFVASLPDQEELRAVPTEIDAAELSRLLALNPGKEPQLRSILKANLACTGPAVTAGTLRMLRTVARALGAERVQKLVSFYEGPDYAAFKALGLRMESGAVATPQDKGAMAKLMAAYPLQAFLDQMNRAGDIIAADEGFMTAAMNCASQQVDALTAAGLKAN